MPGELTPQSGSMRCIELLVAGPDGSVSWPLSVWPTLTVTLKVTMSPIQRQELRRILTEMDAEEPSVSTPP